MKTFLKIGCFAAATALLLSGLGTSALAQETLVKFVTGNDPVAQAFERSNEFCLQVSSQVASCVRILHPKKLKKYAAESNQSVERLIQLNEKAWEGRVNAETEIPALLRFRFGGLSDEQTS